MARNPKLVYGRLTGWGQDGPLAHVAGHSLNYESLTGAIGSIGPAGGPPVPLLQVLGDFAGGGLHLAYGVVCALFEAQRSGKGQVVDAAMIDGVMSLYSASSTAWPRSGMHTEDIGTNLFDGGAPFYNVYETSDGKYVTRRADRAALLRAAARSARASAADDLPDAVRPDPLAGDEGAARRGLPHEDPRRVAAAARRHRRLLRAGVPLRRGARAPAQHGPRLFVPAPDGGRQVAPAPRFSRTVAEAGDSYAYSGADTDDVLGEFGFGADEVARLRETGAVA